MATVNEWKEGIEGMTKKQLSDRKEALDTLLKWGMFDEEFGRGMGVRVLRDMVKCALENLSNK